MGSGVLGIGLLAALITVLAITFSTPVKLAFALGGVALLIPTMWLKDPKAYWLFLLILSIPFDISKYMTTWIASPGTLVNLYGMPASGTITLELYLTDVILAAMVLPWLVGICLKRESLYFPKIGYVFLLYLAWSLFVSLINAQSLYLSIIELCRETLYFLSFVYLINNVSTRPQFRSIVVAVFLGLIIGAGSVILFFEEGIGTDQVAFVSLHDTAPKADKTEAAGARTSDVTNLTLNGKTLGEGARIKRSQGIFRHPAIAASLCGTTLPLALAYLLAASSNRSRIVFLSIIALGLAGLVLTFSRAGLIGLMAGLIFVFVAAGWSGLVSRRLLEFGAIALVLVTAFCVPLLGRYLNTRPQTFYMRFDLFEAALQGYWQHPILGVGLNNGTIAMKAGKQELREQGIPMSKEESADNQYLVVLTEVGPLGFCLFFAFFGKIVMIALRAMRDAPSDLKPLLVGIVGGLVALATQNLSDDVLAGHAISAMLWLFAALIIVIARRIQAKKQTSPAAVMPLSSRPDLRRPHAALG